MFLMVPLGLFHIFFRLNSKTVNNAYTTWPTMVNTRFTQIKFKKDTGMMMKLSNIIFKITLLYRFCKMAFSAQAYCHKCYENSISYFGDSILGIVTFVVEQQ